MNRRLNDQGVNFSNLISRFSIILVKACERFLLRMLLSPDSGPDSSVTRGSVPQDYCHCRCQPKRGSLAAPLSSRQLQIRASPQPTRSGSVAQDDSQGSGRPSTRRSWFIIEDAAQEWPRGSEAPGEALGDAFLPPLGATPPPPHLGVFISA